MSANVIPFSPAYCGGHRFDNIDLECKRCGLEQWRARREVTFDIGHGFTGKVLFIDCADHDEITGLNTYFLGQLHGEQDDFSPAQRARLQVIIDAWRTANEARAAWMNVFDRRVQGVQDR